MPLLIQFIFKLTISLAIVYLFYQLVLRKLTFYNWNRWYLLSYTILSFFIPFINITPVLEGNKLETTSVVNFIPSIEIYTNSIERITQCPVPIWGATWDKWDWALLAFSCGAAFLLVRFFVRFISFYRMRKNARLVANDRMKLYQVNSDIIPFSFGRSVFINPRLHDEAELKEIIRHEFVHVQQRHTHDIIWSELLCILNWYNPFAWLIRGAIRQNLEFIADHKVLENGLDKKQYQYLLLKVIGNSHFSIANQFNFSSLKKRIAMMNKMKSARPHLLKFFFILPLLAVILLAFRNAARNPQPAGSGNLVVEASQQRDTIPATPLNPKGYHIDIIDNKGECIIVVRDRNKKEIERLPLTKWNENEAYYENLYGIILPPPPPPIETPLPPLPPDMSYTWPDNVKSMHVETNQATVTLKNGSQENYDLTKAEDKSAFEKKYGKMPSPPPPVETPLSPLPPDMSTWPDNVKSMHVKTNQATVTLKNGSQENYDLTKPEDKSAFEKKYGKMPPPPPPPPVPAFPPDKSNHNTNISGNTNGNTRDVPVTVSSSLTRVSPASTAGTLTPVKSVAPHAFVTGTAPVRVSQGGSVTSTVPASTSKTVFVTGSAAPATTSQSAFVARPAATGISYPTRVGVAGNGETVLEFRIYKFFSREKLNTLIEQAKAKGIELEFTNVKYDKDKQINRITGELKKENLKTNFSMTDFEVITVIVRKQNGRYFSYVNSGDEAEEI